MKLLLISNSTMVGKPYLEYPKHEIKKFLGKKPVTAVMIPYSAVTLSYDEYCERVEKRFAELGHHIAGLHTFPDPLKAIEEAEAIVIGNGNTWTLARKLHDKKLMNPIRERVFNGTPYIGWSAGLNIAGPTLRTTNDMPIVDPHGFECVGLVPFQINPHYTEENIRDHAGETREQRLEEFIKINTSTYVVGLREGTMLKLEHGKLKLIGDKPCRIFKNGIEPFELTSKDDLTFLMDTGVLA
jgi:dipeptidase E